MSHHTASQSTQSEPAIASLGSGNYVVVWRSDGQDGSQSGVYQQLFGVAAGLPRQANPSLGDFSSRRLPGSFVQPWDRWLQRGMVAARVALGESRWLDTYLVAPVLRFWLRRACWAIPAGPG